jgi:hypothetical protein
MRLPEANSVNAMTLVLLTITKHEARIWANGFTRGSVPTRIFAPSEFNSHHFRPDPKREGRGDGPGVPAYYREIIEAIKGATEILVIGHGNGKANSMVHFIDYLERKAPDLATNVLDSIDTNLIAMSEPQILAMAREWFESQLRA